jgi:hypothetical protein
MPDFQPNLNIADKFCARFKFYDGELAINFSVADFDDFCMEVGEMPTIVAPATRTAVRASVKRKINRAASSGGWLNEGRFPFQIEVIVEGKRYCAVNTAVSLAHIAQKFPYALTLLVKQRQRTLRRLSKTVDMAAATPELRLRIELLEKNVAQLVDQVSLIAKAFDDQLKIIEKHMLPHGVQELPPPTSH